MERFLTGLLVQIKDSFSKDFPCHFLHRQKVTKKLLIPEGDFCARGKAQNHGQSCRDDAQMQDMLSFAAITDRNQHSDELVFKFLLILPIQFILYSGNYQPKRNLSGRTSTGLKIPARRVALFVESDFLDFSYRTPWLKYPHDISPLFDQAKSDIEEIKFERQLSVLTEITLRSHSISSEVLKEVFVKAGIKNKHSLQSAVHWF